MRALLIVGLAVALATIGITLATPTAEARIPCAIGPTGSGCIVTYDCIMQCCQPSYCCYPMECADP